METKHPRISRTPGVCGGKACVAGHRIRVSDIAIWHEHQGLSADAIVSEYPGLTLVDVYSALAYYFEHLEEIRAEMRAESETADNYRSASNPSVLREKLSRNKRVS